MHQHQPAPAARRSGDQGRAVGEPRPGPRRPAPNPAPPAPGDAPPRRPRAPAGPRADRRPRTWSAAGSRPRHRAVQIAIAPTQLDRHEVVLGIRQARPGETQQHAALFHPGAEPVAAALLASAPSGSTIADTSPAISSAIGPGGFRRGAPALARCSRAPTAAAVTPAPPARRPARRRGGASARRAEPRRRPRAAARTRAGDPIAHLGRELELRLGPRRLRPERQGLARQHSPVGPAPPRCAAARRGPRAGRRP